MELQPESNQQAAIRPTQLIIHSLAAPWTARRMYEYWRDSTNLESHFGIGYAGDTGQFIGTQTKADANYSANLRPDGTGAVSVETAANLKNTDMWTMAQLDALVGLGIWMHEEHDVPLRICRSHADPGYGYHRLHSQWAAGGSTYCPGDARVKQFREIVFPRIEAGEGEISMALTQPEIDKIAKAVADRLLRTDGQYKAPADAGDYNPDPADPGHWWSGETVYSSLVSTVRKIRKDTEAILAKLDEEPS